MQSSSGHCREASSKIGLTSSKNSVSIRKAVNSSSSKQFHDELLSDIAKFRIDDGAP